MFAISEIVNVQHPKATAAKTSLVFPIEAITIDYQPLTSAPERSLHRFGRVRCPTDNRAG
jgi:hypothetical protein